MAEDKLPQCINPLSLHIMRLTSEYVSSSSMEKEKESDEESVDIKKSDIPIVDDAEAGGNNICVATPPSIHWYSPNILATDWLKRD